MVLPPKQNKFMNLKNYGIPTLIGLLLITIAILLGDGYLLRAEISELIKEVESSKEETIELRKETLELRKEILNIKEDSDIKTKVEDRRMNWIGGTVVLTLVVIAIGYIPGS